MVIDNKEAQFNDALCARVHRLRNERGVTAAEMAKMLDVPAERYRKYEYRSPLPHYLLERFALIVGRDVEYVLTGSTSSRVPRIAAVASEIGRKLA
jgi:transcriptional regulator with XRE-family HTH domain